MSGWLVSRDRQGGAFPRICVGILLLAFPPAGAAPGVQADSITFGQSACFSGPNAYLGRHYQAGILAAFAEQNNQGGVGGRELELQGLDDGYEPERAAANAEKFVAENNIFAIIGGVGTPTARRIAPVLRSAGIPFVGQVTGAAFLRDAELYPNVISLRAGYLDETRMLVNHIIEQGKSRFGIIYQDDAFGLAVLRNYKAVLDEQEGHYPILAKTTYSRNTHAVHTGLFTMAKADLDAILLVGTYSANAEIINLANALGHTYITANVSFVLSRELKKRIEAPNERILVTEVVPNPDDTDLPLVQRYRRALESKYGQGRAGKWVSEVSLEGYILGRFVIAVLERMGEEWTRENFMTQALSSGPVSLDGWIVEFPPGTNTGSTYVRLINFGK